MLATGLHGNAYGTEGSKTFMAVKGSNPDSDSDEKVSEESKSEKKDVESSSEKADQGSQGSASSESVAKPKKKQIGPRIEQDLARDLKFIVRQLHNGKYKGRLSDEVSNALELYIGKVINDNSEWLDECDNTAQQNRLQQYAEQHREACASVPLDSQVSEELSEMREEIERINSHNTRMLSEIVTQLNE